MLWKAKNLAKASKRDLFSLVSLVQVQIPYPPITEEGVWWTTSSLSYARCRPKSFAKQQRKQFQMVEVKVRMDCEGRERKVRKASEDMKGVSSVEVDMKQNKVTGYVEQAEVLERLRQRAGGQEGRAVAYVPYDDVRHAYTPGAYDKTAPPGYVLNALADPDVAPLARASSTEERYASALSDENPSS